MYVDVLFCVCVKSLAVITAFRDVVQRSVAWVSLVLRNTLSMVLRDS